MNTKEMPSGRHGSFETHNGLTLPAAPEDAEREILTASRCAAIAAGSSAITAMPAAALTEPPSDFFLRQPAARALPTAPQPPRRELRPASALGDLLTVLYKPRAWLNTGKMATYRTSNLSTGNLRSLTCPTTLARYHYRY